MDENHEVVVVGAGPAGAACALELRSLGFSPLVLDRATFPRPKTCAGGLSPGASKVLRRLGLWTGIEKVARHIVKARIEGMWGASYTVLDTAEGWVLPRRHLDSIVVDAMRDRSIDVREGVRVIDVRNRKGQGTVLTVDVDGEKSRIDARWVVLAGGAHMGRKFGQRGGRLLQTLMTRYRGLEHDPEAIELIFDEQIYPHYGWVFPEPDGGCNVGMCVETRRMAGLTVQEIFESFVKRRLAGRLEVAERVGRPMGHPILASPYPLNHGCEGMLFAGEAACLVNPITGEGIGPALRSGVIAAEAVARALREEQSGPAAVTSYGRDLRRKVAPSLMVGELLRLVGVRNLDWVFDNRHWLMGGRRILRAAVQL